MISDDADRSAWFEWQSAMSLIQCVCAWTCWRKAVGGGLKSAAGSSVLFRSRPKSQAHMTPSRPPEYLHGDQYGAPSVDKKRKDACGEDLQYRIVGVDGETVDA